MKVWVLCIYSVTCWKKDWWGYALLEWPTCEAYLFSCYIRILFFGDWNLSPGSPSCQLHCQLFLDCVVGYKVTVFFRSKLNCSFTLAQVSKQCVPLRITLLQKSSGAYLPLFLALFLLFQSLQFFLCDRKSSCCCIVKCINAFLFNFWGQENHQALARCSLIHSVANKSVITGYYIHIKVCPSFDFCNGRRNYSNEPSVGAADDTYVFFSISSSGKYSCIFPTT